MKFQSAFALIIMLCSLFVFSSAQAQNCIEFDQEVIFPCSGQANGEIHLTNFSGYGEPPYTFTWSDGVTADSSRTGLPASPYGVTITAIDGDGTCSRHFKVDLDAKDSASIEGEVINASCSAAADGNIGISVSGPGESSYDMLWSTGETEKNISGLVPGTYTVTVTGFDICPTVASFTVETEPFEINETVNNATCSYNADGSIQLSIVGNSEGYIYNWSNEGSLSSFNGNLEPGSYSVIVTSTDNEDCVLSETYEVGPDPIVVSYSSTDVTCYEESDGTITMDISGGTPPYSHSWSNEQIGPNLINLPAGTYTDTILDAEQCTTNWTLITIEEPLPITVTSGLQITGESCEGSADGSIDLAISGGTPPYSYNWDNGSTTQDISGLTAGEYAVTITDAADCEAEESFDVGSLPEIEVSCTALAADSSQVYNTGKLQVQVSGGSPPYIVNWVLNERPDFNGTQDGVDDDLLVDSLYSGNYSVVVTDTKGCNSSCSVLVGEVFRVKEDSDFIVEFDERASSEVIEAFVDSMEAKVGVEQLKTCNCDSSTAWLQLWHTRDILDINTSGETVVTEPDIDTSGLFSPILIQDTIADPFVDQCTYPITISTQGEASVKVAIIDSGANLSTEMNSDGHPALRNLGYVNTQEVRGNGEDDEGNCCPDDRSGFDYLNIDSLVIDSIGHGTHLAGIIADSYPEQINLQLINLKIYGEKDTSIVKETGEKIDTVLGRGTVFDLVCAIHYAIDQGAKVINLSLGYFDKKPSKPLYRALKLAEKRGILVIVSAGNDKKNLEVYEKNTSNSRWPGRFKKQYDLPDSTLLALNNIIVVGALDSSNVSLDKSYSNFGPALVDIATNGRFYSTHLDSSYLGLKGTSMSAAYISRLFSIVRAYNDSIPAEELILKAIDASTPILDEEELFLTRRFDEERFLENLALTSIEIRTSADAIVTLPFPQPQKTQFNDNQSVKLHLSLYKNYRDVTFEVVRQVDQSRVYYEKLCNAKDLYWNGDHMNGGKVADGRYDYIVTIGDKSFNSVVQVTIGG